MNDKIKIYLPTATKIEEIFHVVCKSNNVFSWKEPYSVGKINEDLPCGENNLWELIFTKPEGYEIKGRSREQTINFLDQAKNKHQIQYFLDDKEQPHKGVLLTFDANATLAAIGTKIVSFLSGEMFLATQEGMYINETEEFYFKAIADFRRIHQFNHNCSYQNALNAISALSAQDLLDMKNKNIWVENDYSLIHTLDSKYSKSYFDMVELNNTLHQNQETTTKKFKV